MPIRCQCNGHDLYIMVYGIQFVFLMAMNLKTHVLNGHYLSCSSWPKYTKKKYINNGHEKKKKQEVWSNKISDGIIFIPSHYFKLVLMVFSW